MITKKILPLLVTLTLSSVIMATDVDVDPATQAHIKSIYEKAYLDAKNKRSPLIAELMEADEYYRPALVKLGFDMHIVKDLTVYDAQWAIEQFHTEHDPMPLRLMLANVDFESLLTEAYLHQGNLLAYCLNKDYAQVFSEIIKAFPRLQANPGVTLFENGLGAPYRHASDLALRDPSIPFIGHLVMENPVSSLEKLLSYGLNNKKLTSADINWIIKEFDKPQYLSREAADAAFYNIFAEDLTLKQKRFLFGLITIRDFAKEGSILSNTKQLLGGHSHSQQHNLLVECVEQGYLKAFAEILAVFPEIIDIPDLTSVTRSEFMRSNGWLRASTYIDKRYSLFAWLMRERNGEKGIYVRADSPKPYYLEACRIISKRFRTDVDLDNPEKEIDTDLFNMTRLLAGQDKVISAKLKNDSEE